MPQRVASASRIADHKLASAPLCETVAPLSDFHQANVVEPGDMTHAKAMWRRSASTPHKYCPNEALRSLAARLRRTKNSTTLSHALLELQISCGNIVNAMLLWVFLSLWRVGIHSSPRNSVEVTTACKSRMRCRLAAALQHSSGHKAYHEDQALWVLCATAATLDFGRRPPPCRAPKCFRHTG